MLVVIDKLPFVVVHFFHHVYAHDLVKLNLSLTGHKL